MLFSIEYLVNEMLSEATRFIAGSLYFHLHSQMPPSQEMDFKSQSDAIDHPVPNLGIKPYIIEHAILKMHNRWLLVNWEGVTYGMVGLLKRL
jgi:hypothetical protein